MSVWVERWQWDTLLSGDWVALATAAVVVSASILGVFAWLKGHRLIPLVTWSGCLAILLLLLSSLPAVEENLPGLANWVDANSDVLTIAFGTVLLLGLIGSVLAVCRLAKPWSFWAQRRYLGDKYGKAVKRHGPSRIKAR